MSKINCWEYKMCGREPGGKNAEKLGVCPAAEDTFYDGLYGGVNGGRACWLVAGTMCGGKVQGTFARKYKSCSLCDFHWLVRREEKPQGEARGPELKTYCSSKERAGERSCDSSSSS